MSFKMPVIIIFCLGERKDGTILVALTGGVNVIDGDSIVASYGEADGIVNTESLTVEEGTNGDIVLGSNQCHAWHRRLRGRRGAV